MAQHDEFMLAVKQGDGPTVTELLRRYPELITSVDEYDKTGLHWAAEKDHVAQAMYASARNGHTEVVKYLLDHGAAIDTKGFFGGTGLHWAAINGHRETVELLIARGASLEIRDERFDSTPEGWTLEGGHAEIVDLLRAH